MSFTHSISGYMSPESGTRSAQFSVQLDKTTAKQSFLMSKVSDVFCKTLSSALFFSTVVLKPVRSCLLTADLEDMSSVHN